MQHSNFSESVFRDVIVDRLPKRFAVLALISIPVAELIVFTRKQLPCFDDEPEVFIPFHLDSTPLDHVLCPSNVLCEIEDLVGIR